MRETRGALVASRAILARNRPMSSADGGFIRPAVLKDEAARARLWPNAVLLGRRFPHNRHYVEPPRASARCIPAALDRNRQALTATVERRDKHSRTGEDEHTQDDDRCRDDGRPRPAASFCWIWRFAPLVMVPISLQIALTRPGRADGSGKIIAAHCVASRRGNLLGTVVDERHSWRRFAVPE